MPATATTDAVARLYRARTTPELVDIPALDFLMIDGRGDPSVSERFREAVQALFAVSYTLKFALERGEGIDYRVGPLEALWWGNDPASPLPTDKAEWNWTAMIRQPALVTSELSRETAQEVADTKRLPVALELEHERLTEGRAAQILHVGPYAGEEPTIRRLHAFIHEHGYAIGGKHHEIYLGDPRRTRPERLKTIIRQPYGLNAR